MTVPSVNVPLLIHDFVWRSVDDLETEIADLKARLASKEAELAMHLAIAAAAKVPRPEP